MRTIKLDRTGRRGDRQPHAAASRPGPQVKSASTWAGASGLTPLSDVDGSSASTSPLPLAGDGTVREARPPVPSKDFTGGPGRCDLSIARFGRAGWPWRLPARAPTDPDVRALAHPVPQTDRFAIPQGSPRLSDRVTWTGVGTSMCSSMFPSIGSAGRRFASLHRVLRGEFPCFDGTIKALRLPAAHPAALRCLRLAVPQRSLVLFAPRRTSAPPRPGVGHPVAPAGISLRKRQDLPSSWGTPIVRLPCSVDAGRTAGTRPLRCRSMAPGMRTAKAPTKGLSTLNSMAFGLAVYASQCGLPRPDARLASGRWSDATGRAFHPQGSDERFQSASLHLILLSQALLGAITSTEAISPIDPCRSSAIRKLPHPHPFFVFTSPLQAVYTAQDSTPVLVRGRDSCQPSRLMVSPSMGNVATWLPAKGRPSSNRIGPPRPAQTTPTTGIETPRAAKGIPIMPSPSL